MPLFAPQLYCADYFPLCRITVYCARFACIFAAPQPLYRGVSWRQRTAAAELAMAGRAPPGVSIEKLAAPPLTSILPHPPFLHLVADMARQEPDRGAAGRKLQRTNCLKESRYRSSGKV